MLNKYSLNVHNFRGWSFLIPGTRSDEQLWGSELFSLKIWGSEKISGKNMGVRNSVWENYGDTKDFLRKIWGHKTFFWKIMGVRNYFWKNYGGAKFFPVFLKTHPTGYPELKKTNPLVANIKVRNF